MPFLNTTVYLTGLPSLITFAMMVILVIVISYKPLLIAAQSPTLMYVKVALVVGPIIAFALSYLIAGYLRGFKEDERLGGSDPKQMRTLGAKVKNVYPGV